VALDEAPRSKETAMRHQIQRSLVIASAIALLIPLATTAAVWAPVVPITDSGAALAWPGNLVKCGSGAAAGIVYQETIGDEPGIYFRRSPDGGATWATPVLLSSVDVAVATLPRLTVSGSRIQAVWVEGDQTSHHVMHRRSGDCGRHWGDGQPISSIAGSAGLPALTNAGDTVVVAWTSETTGKVYRKRSIDGGVTFGQPLVIGQSTNQPGLPDDAGIDAQPHLAMRGQVLHLVYYASAGELRYRRSINSGGSWDPAQIMATTGSGRFPWVAAGAFKHVYVGYQLGPAGGMAVQFRRSRSNGASFSGARTLAGAALNPTSAPIITYASGFYRAFYAHCDDSACDGQAIYFRKSDNGFSWSDEQRATPVGHDIAWPTGIAIADRLILAFGVQDGDPPISNLLTRGQ
jgi:hypothetical protein